MDSLWALGKTKIAVKLLIIFTIVNWAASVPLVYRFGFVGAMIGSVIVLYISLPLTWYYIRKIVKVEVIQHIWPAFLASSLVGLLAFKLNFLIVSLFSLILVGFFGGLVYLTCLFAFDYRQLLVDIRWFLGKIKK